jgi:hypothetical protein
MDCIINDREGELEHLGPGSSAYELLVRAYEEIANWYCFGLIDNILGLSRQLFHRPFQIIPQRASGFHSLISRGIPSILY